MIYAVNVRVLVEVEATSRDDARLRASEQFTDKVTIIHTESPTAAQVSQWIHEVIDYRLERMYHHFFHTQLQADIWRETHPLSVRHKLVYIHRQWHPNFFIGANIEDHRL